MARKNRNAGATPLTSPQTREEIYLANIAGLVAAKPQYPFTRTERYLDAISSSTSGLADRVTALETGKLNVIGKGVNLLDNAYFIGGGTAGVFPVNQQGYTGASAYPNSGRTVDRWWNNAATTVGVEADGLALSATTALFQMLEPSRMRLGETYTLSAIVNGVCYSGTFDYTTTNTVASINCGTAYLRFYGDMWSQTPSKNGVGFDSVTGATKVSALKLELGSQQTLARKVGNNWVLNAPPPNYGEELAKCQRYLIRFSPLSTYSVLGLGYTAASGSGDTAVILLNFPVTMNVTNTIVKDANSGAASSMRLYTSSGSEFIPTSIDVKGDTVTPNACQLVVYVDPTASAGPLPANTPVTLAMMDQPFIISCE